MVLEYIIIKNKSDLSKFPWVFIFNFIESSKKRKKSPQDEVWTRATRMLSEPKSDALTSRPLEDNHSSDLWETTFPRAYRVLRLNGGEFSPVFLPLIFCEQIWSLSDIIISTVLITVPSISSEENKSRWRDE